MTFHTCSGTCSGVRTACNLLLFRHPFVHLEKALEACFFAMIYALYCCHRGELCSLFKETCGKVNKYLRHIADLREQIWENAIIHRQSNMGHHSRIHQPMRKAKEQNVLPADAEEAPHIKKFPQPGKAVGAIMCVIQGLVIQSEVYVDGSFTQRNNASLVEYSGLTAIDFDHIPDEEMSSIKRSLGNDPHTLFGFVSPSGNGLKVIIRHDNTDPRLHDLLYPQIISYYRNQLGIPYVDTSVKDISRATYLAYDPAPYYAPNAAVFHLDPNNVEQVHCRVRPVSSPDYQQTTRGIVPMTDEMRERNRLYQMTWKDKTLMDYLQRNVWNHFPEDFQEGNRNNLLHKARQLCLCGVDYELALEKLFILYTRVNVTETEIEERVRYAYLTNQESFGSERPQWLQRRNEGLARRNQLHAGIWPS